MDMLNPQAGGFLSRVSALLEAHLGEDSFGVQQLAREVGLSRSQLHRRIRKLSGKSPSQYIREYRLQRARELLKREDLTAAEIAYRVGFHSPTYFNTCFRAHYGKPPGEARHADDLTESPIPTSTLEDNTHNSSSRYLKWLLLGGLAVIIILSISFYFNRESGSPDQSLAATSGNKEIRRTLAVLPIRNWSGDPELDYISEGLTDAVISRISMLKDIEKVIPYASITQYKDSEKSLEVIGRELDVDHVLQGNFQLAGESVHINFQLVHVPTQAYLWSDQYSEPWDDRNIFDMQVEVAEKVASLLQIDLDTVEISKINFFPTRNREAYHSFLQAEYLTDKNDPLVFEKALQYYERAIELDPDFLEAYNGLADAYITAGVYWGVMEQNLAWEQAEELLLLALEKDSANIRTHAQLFAGYFYYDWDFERIEEYYHGHHEILDKPLTDSEAAIDFAIKTGSADEAMLDIQMNLHNDLSDRGQYLLKSKALMALGEKEKARQVLETFQAFFSDDLRLLLGSAELYYKLGDYDRAREQVLTIEGRFNNRPPALLWLLAALSQREGKSPEAGRFLQELKHRYEAETSGSPAWYLALYHAELGNSATAVNWLKRSYASREVAMTGLRQEPLLSPVKSTVTYRKLYKAMGFDMYD